MKIENNWEKYKIFLFFKLSQSQIEQKFCSMDQKE